MSYEDTIKKYQQALTSAQKRKLQKQYDDLTRSYADEVRTADVERIRGITSGRDQLANIGLSGNIKKVQSGEINRISRDYAAPVRSTVQQVRQATQSRNDYYGATLANQTIAARNRAAEEARIKAEEAAAEAAEESKYADLHALGVKPYVKNETENDRYREAQYYGLWRAELQRQEKQRQKEQERMERQQRVNARIERETIAKQQYAQREAGAQQSRTDFQNRVRRLSTAADWAEKLGAKSTVPDATEEELGMYAAAFNSAKSQMNAPAEVALELKEYIGKHAKTPLNDPKVLKELQMEYTALERERDRLRSAEMNKAKAGATPNPNAPSATPAPATPNPATPYPNPAPDYYDTPEIKELDSQLGALHNRISTMTAYIQQYPAPETDVPPEELVESFFVKRNRIAELYLPLTSKGEYERQRTGSTDQDMVADLAEAIVDFEYGQVEAPGNTSDYYKDRIGRLQRERKWAGLNGLMPWGKPVSPMLDMELSGAQKAAEAADKWESQYLPTYWSLYSSFYDFNDVAAKGKAVYGDVEQWGISVDKAPYTDDAENKSFTDDRCGTYMYSEEKDTFYYLLTKYGKEEAGEFMKWLRPYLHSRWTGDIGEALNDIPILGGLAQFGLNAFGGVSRGAKGLTNTLGITYGSDYLGKEFIAGVNEGAIKKGGLGAWLTAGVGDSVGVMAPAMAAGGISAAGGASAGVQQALSSGMFAGEIYGYTLAEELEQGRPLASAQKYSLLTTAAEVGLQHVIGGIANFGGISKNAGIEAWLNSIDDPTVKYAATKLLNMGGEFTEESAQTVLAPYFRNIAYGENNKIEYTDEAFESGLAGALTALLFSAAESVRTGRGRGTRQINPMLQGYQYRATLPSKRAYKAFTKAIEGKKLTHSEASAIAGDGVARSAFEKVFGKASTAQEVMSALKRFTSLDPSAAADAPSNIYKLIEEGKTKEPSGQIYRDAVELEERFGRLIAENIERGYTLEQAGQAAAEDITVKQLCSMIRSDMATEPSLFVDFPQFELDPVTGKAVLDSEGKPVLKINKRMKEAQNNAQQGKQASQLAVEAEGNDGGGAQEARGALQEDGQSKFDRSKKASRLEAHRLLRANGWGKDSAADLTRYMTDAAAENDGDYPMLIPAALESVKDKTQQSKAKQAVERLQAKGLEVFLYTDSLDFAGGFTINGMIYLNAARGNINFIAEHEHAHNLAGYIMAMKSYLLDNTKAVKQYHDARNLDLERQGYEREAFDFDLLAAELACDVYAQLRTAEESALTFGMTDMELQELCEKAADILESIADEEPTGNGTGFYDRRSFSEQVDAVLDGTFDKSGNLVYIGQTPSSLRRILGWLDLPMLMRPEKVYLNAVSQARAKQDHRYKEGEEYHALGHKLKNLPNMLDTPVAIIKSNKDATDERILLVTTETNSDGEVIVIALDTDRIGRLDNRKVFANVVLSAYGKRSLYEYLRTSNAEGRILFIDKQKSQRLTSAGGVQFPVGIIDTDYTENLSQYRELVKTRIGKNPARNSIPATPENDTNASYSRRSSADASLNAEQADKLSSEAIREVQSIGRKSINEFTGEDIKKAEPFAKRYFKEMGVKSPFFRAWFGDWRAHDKAPIQMANQRESKRGVQNNADTGWNINVSGKVFNESRHQGAKNQAALPYLEYISDIVRKAVLLDSYSISETKSVNTLMMHSLYALADMDSGPTILKLYVEEMNDPNSADTAKRAYQLQRIELGNTQVKGSGENPSLIMRAADIKTVSDLFALVKQHDKNFKPKPVNPMLLNEDGTPRVFYHGTEAVFNEFDRSKSRRGFFFVTEKRKGSVASYYSQGKADGIKEVYLKIENPFYDYRPGGQWGKAKENGTINKYDGVIALANEEHSPQSYYNHETDTMGSEQLKKGDIIEVIVFNPTQIKSATDNIGTFDESNSDIRYSRRSSPYVSLNAKQVDKLPAELYTYLSEVLPSGEVQLLTDRIRRIAADARNGQLSNSYVLITGRNRYRLIITAGLNYAIKKYSGGYEYERTHSNSNAERAYKADEGSRYVSGRNSVDNGLFDRGRNRGTDAGAAAGGSTLQRTGNQHDSNEVDFRQNDTNEQLTNAPSQEGASSLSEENNYSRRSYIAPTEPSALAALSQDVIADLVASLNNVQGWAFKDISRILDDAAKGNTKIRTMLRDLIELPFNEAGGKYGGNVTRKSKEYLERLKALGITKMEESQAMQRYGEGHYQHPCSIEIKKIDAENYKVKAVDREGNAVTDGEFTYKELLRNFGDESGRFMSNLADGAAESGNREAQKADSACSPYTLEMLKESFPQNYSNIIAAERLTREIYDNYIKQINIMLERVYPYVFEDEELRKERLEQRIGVQQQKIKNQAEVVGSIGARIETVQMEMAGKRRKDTQVYANLKNSLAHLKNRLENSLGMLNVYEVNMATLVAKKQQLLDDIATGAGIRNRRLMPRNDYFHHFKEMEGSIGGLYNILKSNTEISPALVGKSKDTKPRAKWTEFLQRREGGKYTEDAVNGMLKYITMAEYILAYDPVIALLRDTSKTLRETASATENSPLQTRRITSKNANQLIRWLEQLANTIAGKTHDWDRAISDSGALPRKFIHALRWWNNRVKSDTLLLNVRSAIVQVANLTNSVTFVYNPIDWGNAVRTLAKMHSDSELQEIFAKSNFLAQRLMKTSAFDESLLNKTRNFSAKLLSIGDDFSCKLTWWAAYHQYARDTAAAVKHGFREYTSAIDYADDITRRAHGGRGIGEQPNILTSQVVNFFAPFQTEVLNTFNNVKQQLGKKNALGLISMEVSIFVFNTITRALIGDGVLGFDFIQMIIDIIANIVKDDDDEDKENDWYYISRPLGELVSGIPFAAQLASFLMPDERLREKVFGEKDPTRYGTGTLGTNVIADAIGMLYDGRYKDPWNYADVFAAFLPPFGGKQLVRSAKGITTVAQGYGSKKDKEGNTIVQFPVEQTAWNYFKGGLFGKYSLDEGQEYLEEGHALSAEDSMKFLEAKQAGISGKDFYNIRSIIKSIEAETDEDNKVIQEANLLRRAYLLNNTDLTIPQKMMFDRMFISDNDYQYETDDTRLIRLVYDEATQKYTRELVADYRDAKWFELSQTKFYDVGSDIVFSATGANIDNVLHYARMSFEKTEEHTAAELRQQARRELINDNALRSKDKARIDVLMRPDSDYEAEGNQVFSINKEEGTRTLVADYSTMERYKITEMELADRANNANAMGVTDSTFLQYAEKWKAIKPITDKKGETIKSVDVQFTEMLLQERNLSVEQRFALHLSVRGTVGLDYKKSGSTWTVIKTWDDGTKETTVYIQKGKAFYKDDEIYRDFTSLEWYTVSRISDKKYACAREMDSLFGTSPATFARVYKECAAFEADKDRDGNAIAGTKKKKVIDYLKSSRAFSPKEMEYFLAYVMDYKE